MKRQNAIVTTTLILVVIIVGVLLVFVYAKFDQARQTFSDEVAELRQTLDEAKTAFTAPQAQPQNEAAHEKLAQLSLEVEAISSSLERLAEEQKSLSAITQAPQALDLQADSDVESQMIPESNPPRTEPQETASPQESASPAETEDEAARAETETAAQPESLTPEPATSQKPQEALPEVDKREQETEAELQEEALATTPTTTAPDPEPLIESTPTPAEEPLEERTIDPETPEPSRDSTPPASTPEETPEPSQTAAPVPESDTQATAADTTQAVTQSTRIPVGDTPFSVQLLGFYSLDSLQTFAQRHGLKNWLVYDKETYQGRTWYVLIDSLHATRESAEAAAAALPPELDKFDIWIRKLDADDSLYRPEPANN